MPRDIPEWFQQWWSQWRGGREADHRVRFARRRDVVAFDERANRYEKGWLGQLHHEVANRTMAIVESSVPAPQRILDIGCGRGYTLRELAHRNPTADGLSGIDPSAAMVAAAKTTAGDPRIDVSLGVAEALPYRDGAFDLVVSTTSFDHWEDQRRGLAECRRVLTPGGRLVLVDQFSPWLIPTLVFGRRVKARTKHRANALLRDAGFRPPEWRPVYAIIKAATTLPLT
jgi:ubiquinone/menaquinone biosynthesis C-methylase UbiE